MAGARGFELARIGCLCLGVTLVPSTARAQRPAPPVKPLAQSLPPDARRDYDAGKLLFEDGDFATALLKYQAAYERTRDPRLLWNVAVCKKNLRRYAKAAATLAQYVAEGGDRLSASDRKDAQDLIKAIAPFTVAQTITVSQPDAQVQIDDEVVGTSPLPGPIPLDMGTRRLRVHKAGFRLFDSDFPVGGSAPTAVDVVLERQVGHLVLNVPAGATVLIDDKEVGRGPHLELDLPPGAHATRVTAPRMHALQTDVVVEDGASRTLDLGLEVEAAPTAEVHVAVSCKGPDPLSERELTVFLDDSTESVQPMGVGMRRESAREVVAYVPYRVTPGKHAIHVAAKGCVGSDSEFAVPEGGVAEVRGELPPADKFFDGSPAGSPDGWRLSAGLITTSTTFSSYGNFFPVDPLANTAAPTVGVTFAGLVAAIGLQGRWLTGLVDTRLLFASVSGNGPEMKYDSTLYQWSIGVRPGVRLPLVIAALSTGIGLRTGQLIFSSANQGSGSAQTGGYYSEAFWGAIDAQPFCDWGVQLGGELSADQYAGRSVNNGGVTSLWLQATFTPNTLCDRRHAGLFKIVSKTR